MTFTVSDLSDKVTCEVSEGFAPATFRMALRDGNDDLLFSRNPDIEAAGGTAVDKYYDVTGDDWGRLYQDCVIAGLDLADYLDEDDFAKWNAFDGKDGSVAVLWDISDSGGSLSLAIIPRCAE